MLEAVFSFTWCSVPKLSPIRSASGVYYRQYADDPQVCNWSPLQTRIYFPLTFQDWWPKTPQAQYVRTEFIISPFPQSWFLLSTLCFRDPSPLTFTKFRLTLQSDISFSLLGCFPREVCCTFNSIILSVFWTNTQGKQKPSLGEEATMKYNEYSKRAHWAQSLCFHRQGC